MQNLYSIPQELRDLPNWCLWKFEYIEGRTKPTKVPYQINGRKASTTDPSTWTTFDNAVASLQFGQGDGLGFVFTNTPYSGIDLDDAKVLPHGEPNPNYEADFARQIKIYTEFNSYAERSPSGKGCHIIVRGKVPDGKKLASIELYPSGRFFTMTGDVARDTPITDCSDLLQVLYEQMGGNSTVTPEVDKPSIISDEDLLALALAHNTSTFEPLNNGIWIDNYPSQSEADQAYLNIISYYTDSREQVARIFKNSKMYRADKATQNKSYLPRSIKKAFDQKLVVDFQGIDEAWSKIKEASPSGLRPIAHNNLIAGSNPAASTTIFPPGLVGDIAQFIYDAAPKPVREIALAGALGFMAGICGKAYNVSGLGLNQYILMIAGTGKGKEAMASGISKLINAVKLQVPVASEFIGPSAIASKQGLHKYLVKNSPCFVSIIGEFGLTLKAMSTAKATIHQIELQAALLDIYHKSGFTDSYGGSAYSDQDKNSVAISAPAFSILGESTPETFYNELDEKMISSGLLPRFTIIEYDGLRVRSNKNKNVGPGITLVTDLGSLMAQAKTIINTRTVINVQFSPEAEKLSDSIDRYSDDKVNDNPDKQYIPHLYNRAHVKAMKLAALVAVGCNMHEPVITVDHLNWAMALVDNDIRSLSEKFEKGEIGSNNDEMKQMSEITRICREYASRDYDYVKKYSGVESLHKSKIINNSYFTVRLHRHAVFKNDKFGADKALRRCIQVLLDNGSLIEMKPHELLTHKFSGRCYKMTDNILND